MGDIPLPRQTDSCDRVTLPNLSCGSGRRLLHFDVVKVGDVKA